MKKADYATLARIIAKKRDEHHALREKRLEPVDAAESCGALDALDHVAYEFSKSASVDRVEFLKACGIDPDN